MAAARNLLTEASLSGVAQMAGRILRFFVASLALKLFGSASWGEVAYALTICIYLNFVLDFGVSSLALVEKPDDTVLDRRLFVALAYARFGLALVLGVAFLCVLFFGGMPGGTILQLYLLLVLLRPFQLEWWLQRKGFAATMPLLQLVRQALILLILCFFPPDSIAGLALLDVVLECVVAFCSWRFGPRRTFSIAPPSCQEWKDVLKSYRESTTLFLSSSLLLLHQNVDILFLRAFHGFSAVGVYDYSYRFALFAFMAAGSLSIPLRRQLALLRVSGHVAEAEQLVEAAHRVLMILGIGFLFFALYASPWLLALTLPAAEAVPAHQVLVLLSGWLLLAFCSIPFGEWLVTQDRKAYLRVAMLAAVVNVGANLLLVPDWQGKGAAIAKLLSEMGILCLLFLSVTPAMRMGLGRSLCAVVLVIPSVVLFGMNVALPWWIWVPEMVLVGVVLLKTDYLNQNHRRILRSH